MVLLAAVLGSAACGRVGYDAVGGVDAGGGAGRGGSSGAGGLVAVGTGGSTGGPAAGTAGTGGSTGGMAAGAGGAGGVTGAGGSVGGGSAGAGGSVGGGSAGAGGSVGGGSAGAGGSVGGSAGVGGATGGGGAAGTGGGAAGTGGGAAISCYTATFGGHDYAFCDGMVNWATARANCEGRGMRLVRVDDAAEGVWLQATANFSASMFRREALWLGGYEPTTDGDWHWSDGAAFWLGAANGTAVGGLYTNWDPSEPNNAVGPEACLALPLNKTTWWDYECAHPSYFACELY